MARTNAVNFSGALQFPMASTATDVFHKEDVQTLAQAVDQHDHTAGKGLAVAAANASITNAMLGPSVARASLLVNGGFEIWQRGAGGFTTNGGYSADRWVLSIAGTDTLNVTKTTGSADTANGSIAAASCAFTLGTGAGATALNQKLVVADLNQLRGRTVSLSMRVWANMASGVRIGLSCDGTGGTTTNSTYHAGNSAYATLTVTNTIPADATVLLVLVSFAASGTAFLDNANLVVGSQAADYVPLHPADDLARCLRYYEQIGSPAASDTVIGGYAAAASQGYNLNASFRAPKAVTPTVTKVGTWSVVNTAQPSVTSPTVLGFRAFVLSLAAGSESALNDTATSQFTAESNP